jgi:hypothetical protein
MTVVIRVISCHLGLEIEHNFPRYKREFDSNVIFTTDFNVTASFFYFIFVYNKKHSF